MKSLGFTIIELLIVLVIVLLGMTVVGVNFSKVKPSMQLKTVGSEVVSALRFARKQAVKKKNRFQWPLIYLRIIIKSKGRTS